MLVAKKRNDDEGGHWRSARRLMETTVTANEIYEETQVGYCDVSQAETKEDQVGIFGTWFKEPCL